MDPKRAHSWHKCWATLCVGFLVFYKDNPSKAKKTDKILPKLVLTLESISISIENDTKKGKVVSLETRSGAIWALSPEQSSEVHDWLQVIQDARKESNSAEEVFALI